ncbi:hypothetical protein [Streptomyces nogalater]|uniref:Uncharacterized protein n=1 Tax=Streptomyces nogalater TaxID=38314 RepID=A0ABW0WQL5_STRNO
MHGYGPEGRPGDAFERVLLFKNGASAKGGLSLDPEAVIDRKPCKIN